MLSDPKEGNIYIFTYAFLLKTAPPHFLLINPFTKDFKEMPIRSA